MNFDNQNVHGPDVSFYQDSNSTPQQIDFKRMKSAGASFVIIRVGQGNYVDPDFVHNWREAKAAGLPRGSYWFYDSRVGPQYQADKWWSLIKDDPGELPHFLDLEEKYEGDWSSWQNWYDCLARFQSVSKLPNDGMGIYTGFYYWMERAPVNLVNLEWFKRFPLWLGNYNPQSEVIIPPPWDTCLFWQYGTPTLGLLYGAESLEIDMNLFNGSLDSFKSRFGLKDEGQEEEPMSKWYKVTASVLNVRNGPGSNYIDVGDVYKDDILEVVETIGGWHHVDNIWHGGQFVNVPSVAWCSGAYTVLTTDPRPPEPEPQFPPRVGLVVDGVTKWYVPE